MLGAWFISTHVDRVPGRWWGAARFARLKESSYENRRVGVKKRRSLHGAPDRSASLGMTKERPTSPGKWLPAESRSCRKICPRTSRRSGMRDRGAMSKSRRQFLTNSSLGLLGIAVTSCNEEKTARELPRGAPPASGSAPGRA